MRILLTRFMRLLRNENETSAVKLVDTFVLNFQAVSEIGENFKMAITAISTSTIVTSSAIISIIAVLLGALLLPGCVNASSQAEDVSPNVTTIAQNTQTLYSNANANGNTPPDVDTRWWKNEDPAVTKLRAYLRIDTSHPHPDYERAIKWLRRQAKYFGLEFNYVKFPDPDLFAVWFTWKGSDPSLESILLNSHVDVVAADPAKWKYPPFEAYKDERGNIYARGAQDMKSKTIAQLEALRRLKEEGYQPLRTVHVSVIPDEEIGGEHGMKAFVNSHEFRTLNVGVDLDEGGGLFTDQNGTKYWNLSVGNKSAWQFNITATGSPGHGSAVAASGTTAGEKKSKVIDSLMVLKYSEAAKLDQPGVSSSNITTVNIVGLGGGIGNNVLPHLLWAFFDMRIRVYPDDPESWTFADYEKFLNHTCTKSGPGVNYTFFQKGMFLHETVTNESNVWWRAMEHVCQEMNWVCKTSAFGGPTSDAGHVRNAGISAFGYGVGQSKYGRGLGGVHADNEGINEKDFLASIGGHMKVIKSLSMFLP